MLAETVYLCATGPEGSGCCSHVIASGELLSDLGSRALEPGAGGVLVAADRGGADRVLGSRGGVIGHLLPQLYAAEASLRAGDTLVLATDGVAYQSHLVDHFAPAQDNADRILETARKGNDDALVLVARYRGGTG